MPSGRLKTCQAAFHCQRFWNSIFLRIADHSLRGLVVKRGQMRWPTLQISVVGNRAWLPGEWNDVLVLILALHGSPPVPARQQKTPGAVVKSAAYTR